MNVQSIRTISVHPDKSKSSHNGRDEHGESVQQTLENLRHSCPFTIQFCIIEGSTRLSPLLIIKGDACDRDV